MRLVSSAPVTFVSRTSKRTSPSEVPLIAIDLQVQYAQPIQDHRDLPCVQETRRLRTARLDREARRLGFDPVS